MNRSRARSTLSTLAAALADLFSSSHWLWWRTIFAGIALLVALTFVFWKLMLPFWLVVGGVVLFLRLSRPKDSL
ncbi:MAG TPA: hypothetical protein VJA94_09245 [Candidatus Angelobacter sp.]